MVREIRSDGAAVELEWNLSPSPHNDTLLAVVQHYNEVFNLRMTDSEMNDLAEYLKSL